MYIPHLALIILKPIRAGCPDTRTIPIAIVPFNKAPGDKDTQPWLFQDNLICKFELLLSTNCELETSNHINIPNYWTNQVLTISSLQITSPTINGFWLCASSGYFNMYHINVSDNKILLNISCSCIILKNLRPVIFFANINVKINVDIKFSSHDMFLE